MKIRRLDGKLVNATYVRHISTITGGSGRPNIDADLFRLDGGELIVCESRADDARSRPSESEGWDNTLTEIREREAANV